MTQLQIIFLSALQGFTEFLPVSSSGHLILFSKFTAFPDQGLEMDIAVHVGSILAVAIYFYRDIWEMLCGLLNAIFSRFSRVREYYLRHASDKMKNFITKTLPQYDCKLLLMLVVGTIPAVFFGLLLHHFGMEWLRSTKIVGWNILLFGIILWIADRYRPSARQITDMTLKDAVIIGFAQCMAMIPGTSRSGITITASRFLGINRREAAKFCMLLSFQRHWLFFHRLTGSHFHHDELVEKLHFFAFCHLPHRTRRLFAALFLRLYLTGAKICRNSYCARPVRKTPQRWRK